MKFSPNSRFEEELRVQAEIKAGVVRAADGVRRRVESAKHTIMPRASARPVVVEVDGDQVRVTNTDHGAWIDEVGSAKNPPYAPLRRSVRAAGLRLDEHGK